jgi:hypothetical protein
MRFLVSMLLLAMFSSSAIAKEEDRWLYLYCNEVAGQTATFAIDLKGIKKVETDLRSFTIQELDEKLSKRYESSKNIFSAASQGFILFQGYFDLLVVGSKRYLNYKMYFLINRINGFLSAHHWDERTKDLTDKRYSFGECRSGRRF